MTAAVSIRVGDQASPLEQEAARLLSARLSAFSPAAGAGENATGVVLGTPATSAEVAGLGVDRLAEVGAEGFVIVRRGDDVVVAGNEPAGVLYGVGRLLHGRTLALKGEVRDRPRLAIRNIYFADHMGNWYSHAPEEEVFEYLEEMALWGYNELMTTLAVKQGETFHDSVARVRRLEEYARRLGMRAGPVIQSNTSFMRPREEWKATPVPIAGAYDVCPSQPGAFDFLVEDKREYVSLMEPFDFVCFWAYDGGGCACDACTPWSGTFVDLSRAIAEQSLSCDPEVWVSAWFFERYVEGEDDALFSRLADHPTWFKRLVVGADEGRRWVEKGRQVPEQYDVVLFPDIAMFDGIPWGGRGGNPGPRRFAAELADTRSLVHGGVVYSEGRYDDVNKVLWARLLWDPDLDPADAVRDYCRAYFSPEVADAATDLIMQIEEAMEGLPDTERWRRGAFHPELDDVAADVEARLSDEARASWRWELLRAKTRMEWLYARLNKGGGERDGLVAELRSVYERVRDDINLHDPERSLPTWFWAPLEEAFPATAAS